MKKASVFFLIMSLTVTLFTVTPALARPNHFWPGVAIGVGTAILLGQIFHPPRVYDNDYRPVRVSNPPDYYSPPPPAPVSRERWVPGHWVEGYDAYGNYERYWIPEHWERIY